MKFLNLRFSFLALAWFAVLFSMTAGVTAAQTDPFVGEFVGYADDDRYYLSIKKTPDGNYRGQLQIEGENVALSATKQGGNLVGEINEDGDIYEFTATAGRDGSLNFIDEDGESVLFQPRSSEDPAVKPKKAGHASGGKTTPQAASKGGREVYINRVKLDPEKLQSLESLHQTRIETGRYWYDGMCGAWGAENGPTVGFIMAGLDLGGPMPADISGGGTGIFINGREIHPLDQRGLQQLFGITYRGRYWLDAQGNLGVEGGPSIVNIVAAIPAAKRRQAGKSTTHGYGSASGARGTLAGDGRGGHMYSGRTATEKSVFWYPGM